jgi:hypothetical protein
MVCLLTIDHFLSILIAEIFENIFQLGRTLTSPSCAPSLAFPEREKISISTESKKNKTLKDFCQNLHWLTQANNY